MSTHGGPRRPGPGVRAYPGRRSVGPRPSEAASGKEGRRGDLAESIVEVSREQCAAVQGRSSRAPRSGRLRGVPGGDSRSESTGGEQRRDRPQGGPALRVAGGGGPPALLRSLNDRLRKIASLARLASGHPAPATRPRDFANGLLTDITCLGLGTVRRRRRGGESFESTRSRGSAEKPPRAPPGAPPAARSLPRFPTPARRPPGTRRAPGRSTERSGSTPRAPI